jgi:hypothetical protein
VTLYDFALLLCISEWAGNETISCSQAFPCLTELSLSLYTHTHSLSLSFLCFLFFIEQWCRCKIDYQLEFILANISPIFQTTDRYTLFHFAYYQITKACKNSNVMNGLMGMCLFRTKVILARKWDLLLKPNAQKKVKVYIFVIFVDLTNTA